MDTPKIKWRTARLVALFSTLMTGTAALAETTARELNAAEKWIAEQVSAGKVADLAKHFSNENDRKVRASFLEDLLTGTLPAAKPHRNGVHIFSAIVEDAVNLRNARIASQVSLKHCLFTEDVFFEHATFDASLSFYSSTFKAGATFDSMKVTGSTSFAKVRFEGAASFSGAEILGHFMANDAQFKDPERSADFDNMRVSGTVFIRNAVFDGPANFIAATIADNLEAHGSHFNNREKAANFNSLKVGRTAFFIKAVFEGEVNFVTADIASVFVADDAHFNNKEKDALFYGMKVTGFASFNRVVFEGGINLGLADIRGHLTMNETQLLNKRRVASFAGLKVQEVASFTKTVFQSVSLVDSYFLDLIISGANSDADPVPVLDLSRSSIKRQLVIRKTRIRDLLAPSLRVEGPADLIELTIGRSADFSDASFGTVDVSKTIWPRNGNDGAEFHLRGMSYKYIRADANESKSHEILLKLAGQSAFDADVYGNLQAFFSHLGYSADADRAFIAGKRRERKELLHGIRSFGSWGLDVLVGYGRRPWKASLPCAFFVVLGWFLFSSRKMEPSKPDEVVRIYNPLWYSLGLFLPIVNLQSDGVWKPKNDCRFLRHYVRIHILLGWILIPIVVAALTGLIK